MSSAVISGSVLDIYGVHIDSSTRVRAVESLHLFDDIVQTVVDPDGLFSIPIPAPATYNIFADAYGYTLQAYYDVSISDGEARRLDFRLPMAGGVSGTVRGAIPAGRDITVFAYSVQEPATGFGITLLDSSNNFRIDDLDAVSDGNPSGNQYVIMTDIDDTTAATIVVSPGQISNVDLLY